MSTDSPPPSVNLPGTGPMQLLLVEDSKFDARLIETFLSMAEFPRGLEVQHVSRLSEARQALEQQSIDCVLLDLGLPDGEGLGNIEAITQVSPDTAIIVLTGLKNDTIATTALQQGAQDYIVKGDYEDGDALLRTIRYAIERRAKEVKESQAVRRASEDLIRSIVTAVPDGLVTVREGGLIETVNPAMVRMFGYSIGELVGSKIHELSSVTQQRPVQALMESVLADTARDEDRNDREGIGRRKDGSEFPIEVSIGRMMADGSPMVVCAIRDITERKKAEESLEAAREQLLVSEKLASLGGLVAGVAHEINTPIGIGVTAASHLQEQTEDLVERMASGQLKKSQLEAYVQMASDSAGILLGNLRRAAELIQGFKQVAVDQSSDERRSFEVRPYLDDVLLSLAPNLRKTPHKLDFSCEEGLILSGHPGNWSQIVTNLVMNALLHAFESDKPGTMTLAVRRVDGRILMTFSDDGRGIPPDQLKQIFDPFFTTRRGQGGSGLGLHVVYNLATQAMDGRVSCESELGKGTRFAFDFPYVPGAP